MYEYLNYKAIIISLFKPLGNVKYVLARGRFMTN